MNKMSKFVLSALSVLGIAACAVSSTDEASVLGESQEALTGPTGTGFFGSDTLYSAITAAVAVSGVLGLTYLGTGTDNGETCLTGAPPGVAWPGGPYCNGAKQQTIAPMSRDFSSTCQPGEISHRIALDAVALWTKSTQTATNAPVNTVRGAFCGDGTGSAASCALTDTWGEFAAGSSNPANTIKLYRHDNLSGTTDAFEAFIGCITFCSSVKESAWASSSRTMSTRSRTPATRRSPWAATRRSGSTA